MVTKRAMLIGCNYPGTDAALKGCVNDVQNMRDLLVNEKGFHPDDVVVMIDTDDSYPQPTGANIRKGLKKLSAAAQPGDVIYVHFSGHGVEVPPETMDPDDDGLDQCVCPTDMNLLTDDDFREFVSALPDDVDFTMVSDSCHSGGLIEQTKEQVGPKTAPTTRGSGGGSGGTYGARGLPAHGYQGHQGGRLPPGCRNKSLPLDMFAKLLSQQAGHDVGQGNIRTSLYGVFGEDSSPSVQVFVGILSQHGPKLMQQLQEGDTGGLMSTFGKMAMSYVQTQISGKPPSAVPSKVQEAASGGSMQQAYAGGKRHDAQGGGGGFFGRENCVLISGCQSNETSADVTPDPSDPSSSHGALTYTLLKVMKREGHDIGYKELVLKVREELQNEQYTQHPCLYSGDHMTEKPFITKSASSRF